MTKKKIKNPLPTNIKIGPFYYSVYCDAPSWYCGQLTIVDQPRPYGYGFTHHKSESIYLNPNLEIMTMRDTLWHEIKHVVFRVAGFVEEDKFTEEFAIERSTAIELGILRDNPDLVAYLLGD